MDNDKLRTLGGEHAVGILLAKIEESIKQNLTGYIGDNMEDDNKRVADEMLKEMLAEMDKNIIDGLRGSLPVQESGFVINIILDNGTTIEADEIKSEEIGGKLLVTARWDIKKNMKIVGAELIHPDYHKFHEFAAITTNSIVSITLDWQLDIVSEHTCENQFDEMDRMWKEVVG